MSIKKFLKILIFFKGSIAEQEPEVVKEAIQEAVRKIMEEEEEEAQAVKFDVEKELPELKLNFFDKEAAEIEAELEVQLIPGILYA